MTTEYAMIPARVTPLVPRVDRVWNESVRTQPKPQPEPRHNGALDVRI